MSGEVLQPPGWAKPVGYANGLAARGRLIFVAGQVGWNPETSTVETDDFVAQAAQALRNVVAVVREGGGASEHVARMTWFVTDKAAYLAALPRLAIAYREVFGRHYPAMSVVVVAELLEPRARVEIEATAVVPE